MNLEKDNVLISNEAKAKNITKAFTSEQEERDKHDTKVIIKGTYANTLQNRKLGRVGQEYGGESKKIDRKDITSPIKTAKELDLALMIGVEDAFSPSTPGKAQSMANIWRGKIERAWVSGKIKTAKDISNFLKEQMKGK